MKTISRISKHNHFSILIKIAKENQKYYKFVKFNTIILLCIIKKY